MSLPTNAPDSSSASVPPLADRVQARVAAARAEDAARPRGDGPNEVRALRRVFRDMGRAQRIARRRTGELPSPIVRQAAAAFRAAPSLPALLLVAAALDEAGLFF